MSGYSLFVRASAIFLALLSADATLQDRVSADASPPTRQEGCILYQSNSLRLRSTLQLLARGDESNHSIIEELPFGKDAVNQSSVEDTPVGNREGNRSFIEELPFGKDAVNQSSVEDAPVGKGEGNQSFIDDLPFANDEWNQSFVEESPSWKSIKKKRNGDNELNLTVDANLTVNSNLSTDGNDSINVNGSNVTANTTGIKVEHKILNSGGKKKVFNSRTTRTKEGGNISESEPNKTKHRRKIKPEPFAKENVTVHWHNLNITRRVNETHNRTQNVTIKETIKTVKVDTPLHIVFIYCVLYLPLMIAWGIHFHNGCCDCANRWLLPLTLCTQSVGQDFANQSLTMILGAPNAITAIQAFSMAVATGLWMISVDGPALRKARFSKLKPWSLAAALFAVYQLVNHLVYAMCSLSERTVFTNLCPLISLATETILFPNVLKPATTFRSKLSLAVMLVGAVLFSIQSPTFTTKGLRVSIILVLTTVPYRLAQRHFLAEEGGEFPLSVFAFIDGVVLFPPAAIISAIRRNLSFLSLFQVLSDLPVFLMLLVSIATFTFTHITSLAMLRAGSATTYLVFQNIASIATVTLGIFFFGDRVLRTPLACVGLAANLGAGIWYSAEAQLAGDVGDVSDGTPKSKEGTAKS